MNRDQHQPLPKALPPLSQPHKQKLATKETYNVINFAKKEKEILIKKPDTQMTGMLPCLVLPATIIAISGKTDDFEQH